MAASANHSDSCHAAELDASCLLSDNYILADLWEHGDCSYTCRQTHLSLVTVTWLIKIFDAALIVAYLFLTCNRTEREGKKENYWLIGQERRD